jgi:hypothetical protein
MKIIVTAEHIKNGVRKKCDKCPAALAVREQSPFKDAEIGYLSWTPSYVANWRRITDLGLVDFVARFDNQLPVEPFEFNLDLPS